MGDEIAFKWDGLTLLDLYSHRGYIEPEYGAWENWYAWYPIKRITWHSADLSLLSSRTRSFPVKVYRWEWRTYLLRRRVVSKVFDFSDRKKSQWEYVTMEEALQWA